MDNVDWKVEQLLVICEYKNLWTSLLTSSLIISFYMIDDVVQDVKFIYTRLAFKLWFKYINFYYSNNCCSMTVVWAELAGINVFNPDGSAAAVLAWMFFFGWPLQAFLGASSERVVMVVG